MQKQRELKLPKKIIIVENSALQMKEDPFFSNVSDEELADLQLYLKQFAAEEPAVATPFE